MPYYTHQTSVNNIKGILIRGLDPDYGDDSVGSSDGIWANKVKSAEITPEDLQLTVGKWNENEIVILFKTNIKSTKEDDLGYTFGDEIIPPSSFLQIAYQNKIYTIDNFKKTILKENMKKTI